MIPPDDLFFEISRDGQLVRVKPELYQHHGSEYWYDNNWIMATVKVKGGSFYGEFRASFLTIDFENFKQELKRLYNDLNGKANFVTLEGQLELNIIGNGIGGFDINVTACDQPGIGSQLIFEMTFDQTFIMPIIAQLERITSQFPVVGEING